MITRVMFEDSGRKCLVSSSQSLISLFVDVLPIGPGSVTDPGKFLSQLPNTQSLVVGAVCPTSFATRQGGMRMCPLKFFKCVDYERIVKYRHGSS